MATKGQRSYTKCVICENDFRTFKCRPRKFCSRECYKKSMIGNTRGFTREKMLGNKINLGRKLSKEHIKKCLKRNPKSTLEIKFENIINKFGLPYKFVGDGEFFIERKCPDFINTNDEKIAIEVFYKRHKEQFRGGLNQWKEDRNEIFNKEGFKLLFFDETQVNENMILNKMGGI